MFNISHTISDIARLAGVSTATVSRALNTPEIVQAETRERIMDVIKKTNYVPNPLAKALSTGQSNLVGMLLPTLTNSVFAQMAEGCQHYFLQHNLNLVVISGQSYHEKELDVLKSIDQRQVKGFIISGSAFVDGSFEIIMDNIDVPAVILERMPTNCAYSSVYIDDEQGVIDVLKFYLANGHTHIAVVSGELNFVASQRRLLAIRNYLADNCLHNVRLSVEAARFADMESGRLALHRLMERADKPTAIICLNDIIALGALKGANELGIQVPADMEIIGFDNIPMTSYSTPALSTINSPNAEVGQRAARLLLEHIKNPQKKPEQIILPVELLHRESSRV
ncbi:MAG: LacI family DNA-binding transcriptional regulator [Clostridia bacterium]